LEEKRKIQGHWDCGVLRELGGAKKLLEIGLAASGVRKFEWRALIT
jgi:hypothetical protein